MQIRKLKYEPDVKNISNNPPLSSEQLQREIDYYRAEKILKKMLERNLISNTEFNKIMGLNRVSFAPVLARLMPETLDI
ncbi:hypothetical protein J2Z35_002511 [Acetoanaerobium pronyense]|uniref:SHOCT-like domain-containing protein n=1 Tax=Acetoanaerobium pronyense TaxID=1482736 RepID=A0ABS4KNH1_9FIRM|nr:SHOCT domain-containing protein [Acetoanaerobium pronyense]MBP2028681.1 hypothetical protein [Acetoanaerobium pronyense]